MAISLYVMFLCMKIFLESAGMQENARRMEEIRSAGAEEWAVMVQAEEVRGRGYRGTAVGTYYLTAVRYFERALK